MFNIENNYILINIDNFNNINYFYEHNYIFINTKKSYDFVNLIDIDHFSNLKNFYNFLNQNISKTKIIHYKNFDIFKDIKNYFKNNKNIWNQFDVDIKRSILFINNQLINNINAKKYFLSKYNYNISTKIAALCTQGIFAFIINKIQLYLSEHNLYIGEIENIKNINKKIKINIYIHKFVEFKISKKMRVFKVNKFGDDITKQYLNFLLEYNLNTPGILITITLI